MVANTDTAVPQVRTKRVLIDRAGGRIQTRTHRQLIDIDGARDMPAEVADIPYVQDYAARQLLLNAKIVRNDAGGLQAARQHRQVRWKVALRAAGGIVDVPVENAGRHIERRVAARVDQHIGRRAVIKNAEPSAHGRVAAAERIVSEAESRTDVAVVRAVSAAREPYEQALQGRIARGGNAPLCFIREAGAEERETVIRIARSRRNRPV